MFNEENTKKHTRYLNKKRVYEAFETEREYQDAKWGDTASSGRPGNGEWSIDEFALYIKGYTDDLVKECSHFGGAKSKLDIMRKIGALVVACGEQHCMPFREPSVIFKDEVPKYDGIILTSSTPHVCPVCTGKGIVPNGFYMTTNKNYTTSDATPEKCRSCVNGLIWT